jgi:FdhE protein
VLGRSLRSVLRAFGEWRDEERWLRNYCPTCGELPAMAQLIGVDPGRLRFLSCGCCRTRWRYRRTACPFCDSQRDHRLSVLAVDGEHGLRIDYCDTCRGYLKTYNGAGSEGVLLADWTSLHLDFIARDRGLKRSAASLYELESTR